MNLLFILLLSFLLGSFFPILLSFIFKNVSNKKNNLYEPSSSFTLSYDGSSIIFPIILTFFGMFTVINLANSTIRPIQTFMDFIMYFITFSLIFVLFFALPFKGIYDTFFKKVFINKKTIVITKMFSTKTIDINDITIIEKHYRNKNFTKIKNENQRAFYENNYIYIFYHEKEKLFKIEPSMDNTERFIKLLLSLHATLVDNLKNN